MKTIQPQSDPSPTLQNLVERTKEGMIQSMRNERAVIRGLSVLRQKEGEHHSLSDPRSEKRLLAILLGCLGIVFLLTLTILSTRVW
jgi:hypothetical protein